MPFYREVTRLLEVFRTTKEELSKDFLQFDTQIEGTSMNYELPEGNLLVLFLVSLQEETGIWQAWTTVRSALPGKEEYYRSLRGQRVEIVIA